jgi:ParB-like chromosome segregation protein Spo0J
MPEAAQQIEQWPLDRLVPYARNARTHSAAQVAQIAASIREFGFNAPILASGDGTVIAGHGRLAAARQLALDTVPVVVLDHLTDNQRRAYIITDNKLALNAGWEFDLLTTEIDDLKDNNFDLTLLGFSDDELAAFAEDGWSSDIESVERYDKNLDGIKAKISVTLDNTYKDEVLDAIKSYCNEHAISIEVQ